MNNLNVGDKVISVYDSLTEENVCTVIDIRVGNEEQKPIVTVEHKNGNQYANFEKNFIKIVDVECEKEDDKND